MCITIQRYSLSLYLFRSEVCSLLQSMTHSQRSDSGWRTSLRSGRFRSDVTLPFYVHLCSSAELNAARLDQTRKTWVWSKETAH